MPNEDQTLTQELLILTVVCLARQFTSSNVGNTNSKIQYFSIKILLEKWVRLGLRLVGEGGLGSF